MNSSHKFDDIPAHRVVNRNGLLTGKIHFDPPAKMEELLKKEGIEIVNDAVIFMPRDWANISIIVQDLIRGLLEKDPTLIPWMEDPSLRIIFF